MVYHKIQTLFQRTPKGEMILGDWTDPVFEYLANNTWRMTEKIDGTNIRVEIGEVIEGRAKVRFGGRAETSQLPAKLVRWLEEKFLSEEMLETLDEKFPGGAILYGEGFGAGIQKGGGNYQNHQSFILFDVRVGEWWLNWENVIDVANTLQLPYVPVVGFHTLHEGIELLKNGVESHFGPFPAEGVVAIPHVPLFNRKGERVITKIKTRDFERAVEKETA